MSSALQHPMTIDEFLAWERQQDTKHEFDGVAVRAMVGVKPAHAAIQVNLVRAAGSRLDGSPCRIWGSDLKVRTQSGIRYPDAMITCGPVNWTEDVVASPVVLFEILSPSSVRVEQFIKNAEYRQIASVEAYVIVQQDFIGATMAHRSGADWVTYVFGPGATLDLPGPGIQLPLNELYRGLEYDVAEIAP